MAEERADLAHSQGAPMSAVRLTPEELARQNAAAMRMPLLEKTRFSLVSQTTEGVVATIEVTPEASLFSGHLNGVELYGLLDCTAWFTIAPHLGPDEAAVTHDAHFSILTAAPAGATVELRGTVMRRGRTTAFVRTEGLVGGKVFALGTITKSIIAMAVRTRHADKAPL